MELVFAFVLSLSVVYDLRERRIPNALTLGGLCAALCLRLAMEPASIWAGVLGAGLGLGVALPLFAIGAFGAGDGKLLVAVGAFLGLDGLPAAILATGIFGGLLSMVSLWRRGVLLPVLRQVWDLALFWVTLGRMGKRRTLATSSGDSAVPYGVAIAAGAALIWATGITIP
jgi:prepilin peptidase CpaA